MAELLKELNWFLFCFCILVNGMAFNCTNRVKYVDDATVMEFVPRLSPSYLNVTVSDIYSFASSRGMVLNGKKCQEMCISFLQYCPFPVAPIIVGSSLIEKVSCYKLLGVHLLGVHLERACHSYCKERE